MRKPEDTVIEGGKTMKFVTHNDVPDIDLNGTCYVGAITARYADLVKAFGQPTGGDGYKIDAEWELRFDDGSVAAIYNWKDGHNYNDGHGTDVEDITDWHIGGRDEGVVRLVIHAMRVMA